VVKVDSGCKFDLGPRTYNLSVDLDAVNLAPAVTIENPDKIGKQILVHGLQAIVTNGDPTLINFEATTSKYDVTWKFSIDYTVNGHLQTAWIQNGSQPFRTVARRPTDPTLTFIRNTDNTWLAHTESSG
jgi:hypothetical protein